MTGGPLQGPSVDVPTSIAVTRTLVLVAVRSRNIIGLFKLAHREGNGARSPTGTSASLPSIEVMRTTYRIRYCKRRS